MSNTDPRVNAVINNLIELCHKKGSPNASLNVDMDTCTENLNLVEFWTPRNPSRDPEIIRLESSLLTAKKLLDAKQKQQKDLQDRQEKLAITLNQHCIKFGGASYARNTCSTDPIFSLGAWPWESTDSTQIWSPKKPSQNPEVIRLEAQLAATVSQLERIGSEINILTDQVTKLLKQLSAKCQSKYHATLSPDAIESDTNYSLEAGCSVFPKKVIWSDRHPDPDAKILINNLKALRPSLLPEKWILTGAVGIVILIGFIVIISNRF